MRLLKLVSVMVVVAGIGSLVYAQGRSNDGAARGQRGALTVLAGRGAEIGVTIGDVVQAEKGPATPGGVLVEDVRADGPADKAGLKRADVIVEFDGEHVRSARQFTRLVQETAPGRTVKATIMRDGQRKDVQITPVDGREGNDAVWLDGPWRSFGDLGRLTDRVLPFNFDNHNFSFTLPQLLDGRGRLGVSVDELTPQLATYFGAKEGLLVSSVTEDSPASRAGLKAGDVITKVNDEPVRSRDDLVRLLRDTKDGGDVAIRIVRDKKESTVTAKLESRRPARVGRPA